jgi:hypothetical protein
MGLEAKVKNLGKGLLVGSMLALAAYGCTPRQPNPEKEVYGFAGSLCNEKGLEKARSGSHGWIYHDKSLEVGDNFLMPGMPKSGSGRYIRVYPDGDMNAGFWDYEKMKAFSEGNNALADTNLIGIEYKKDKDEIMLFNKSFIAKYSKKNGRWAKTVYDAAGIKGELKLDRLPVKSETYADEKEVKSYLNLIERLRKSYPSEGRTDSADFSIRIEPK